MPPARSSPIAAIQKLMGLGASIFRRGFNSSNCKTEAKLATARIKLLRNRREVQVRQMRRDIAVLLQSGNDDTARIRVEHVIREQNTMAANEIIELFCELVVARLPIISKQRDCPADLKEGISSLIYAAPRCSDIPELQRIRDIFEKKYGKDFVSAATDLRPESGVNRMLIEKLSVRKPSGEVKLKIMKEIAKEYQIKWDTAESELELLKPPEELINGPSSFICATSMPMMPTPEKDVYPDDHNLKESSTMYFKDTAAAVRAAAESAEKAVYAAKSAANLAQCSSHHFDQTTTLENLDGLSNSRMTKGSRRNSLTSMRSGAANESSLNEFMPKGRRVLSSRSFNVSNNVNDEDMESDDLDDKRIPRRNSCIDRTLHSDIKFDESDGFDSDRDQEVQVRVGPPPKRPPPLLRPQTDHFEDNATAADPSPHSIAHVHPKLPDYEALAARFEALKSRKF